MCCCFFYKQKTAYERRISDWSLDVCSSDLETAAEMYCTLPGDGGPTALEEAVERVQREAEDAVRGGCTHVILSDTAISADRAGLPMILASGAVHSHLVRQQLRTFTSVNVRCGECLDVHYFAVLIGVGATTINPYLAQEAIADRQARGSAAERRVGKACVRTGRSRW